MKKILAIFGAFLLFAMAFLASPASASASSRSCGSGGFHFSWPWHHNSCNSCNQDNDDDDEDDDDSDTTVINEDNDTVDVHINSHASVWSKTFAKANTGGNSQDDNDDENEINTGDAWAEAHSTNVVNTNTVEINVD